MYMHKMYQEAKAIVKAVEDRRKALEERNSAVLESLPKPELMYWNLASQLNGKRKEFDRRIRLEAEKTGLDGIKLVDMLNLSYENYLEQSNRLGNNIVVSADGVEQSRDNGKSRKATEAIDYNEFEARLTSAYQAPGFKPRETGMIDKDPETGELVPVEGKRISTDFSSAVEEKLEEFFGE